MGTKKRVLSNLEIILITLLVLLFAVSAGLVALIFVLEDMPRDPSKLFPAFVYLFERSTVESIFDTVIYWNINPYL